MEKDKRLKEQELEIRTLNAQKRVDTKKIKELELEVRKLQSNELKTKKYKSEVPNHRRGDLSDDSDKEESDSGTMRSRQAVAQRDQERDLMLQLMMGNMFEMRHNLQAQRAEDEMLQKALEESRQTAGV